MVGSLQARVGHADARPDVVLICGNPKALKPFERLVKHQYCDDLSWHQPSGVHLLHLFSKKIINNHKSLLFARVFQMSTLIIVQCLAEQMLFDT